MIQKAWLGRPEKSHNMLFQEDSSGGDLKREKGGGGGGQEGKVMVTRDSGELDDLAYGQSYRLQRVKVQWGLANIVPFHPGSY